MGLQSLSARPVTLKPKARASTLTIYVYTSRYFVGSALQVPERASRALGQSAFKAGERGASLVKLAAAGATKDSKPRP